MKYKTKTNFSKVFSRFLGFYVTRKAIPHCNRVDSWSKNNSCIILFQNKDEQNILGIAHNSYRQE